MARDQGPILRASVVMAAMCSSNSTPPSMTAARQRASRTALSMSRPVPWSRPAVAPGSGPAGWPGRERAEKEGSCAKPS
eukprot:15495113-Heterocapsa_arctica.AAC.1